MVRTSSILSVAVALGISSVNAFERSSPLVAWSSFDLSSISSLVSSSQPARSVFGAPSTAQIPLSVASSSSPSSSSHDLGDLCSLSSVLIISVPGIHASDLSLLPSARASPAGVRSSLASAASKVQELYLSATEIKRAVRPRSIAKHFVAQCGAVVERAGEANLWSGESGKSVKFDRVDGLEDYELTGTEARSLRKEIMQNVDQVIAQHLSTLSAPYLVILTALPSPLVDHSNVQQLVKRDLLSSIESEIFGVVPARKKSSNGTNIFYADPSSGLFHRYVFFTPALIFCLLLAILILIPVVLISISALSSIETVAGLEGKMTGTVGLEKS